MPPSIHGSVTQVFRPVSKLSWMLTSTTMMSIRASRVIATATAPAGNESSISLE